MRLFKHHCREVTRLVLLGQDRQLAWHERLLVRLHQRVCDHCTRFQAQVRLMNGALRQWRAYRDAGDALEPGRDPARD